MRWFVHFLGFVFGLPLLCMIGFVALMMSTVFVTASQLPGWAQKPVIAWIMGIEQMTNNGAGVIEPSSSPAGVGVGWDGYVNLESFALPNGIPLDGNIYITCDFHDPNYTSHTGVDLGLWPEATLGAPIYTTLAGKVVWAGWNGLWGNLVVVENNGYQVWFAHLSEIEVSEGEIISYGELVGLVGSTGNSTGPHLHYGIKHQTEKGQVWLDPLDYFGGEEYGWSVCE